MASRSQPTAPERRASLGWRVAGAFVRRREASIFVVAVAAVDLLLGRRTRAFARATTPRTSPRRWPRSRCRGRGGDAADLRRDRPRGRPRLRPRPGDRLRRLLRRRSTACRSGSACSPHSASRRSVGLMNGVITTFLRVPSFITTLGMLFLLNGDHAAPARGHAACSCPGGETFQKIFGSQPDQYTLFLNSEFFWALGLVLLVQFVLTWTRWGLHTVATGGNLIGAAESGVNVRTDQDRQLRPRQPARRLRRDPRLDPDHDDRAAAGRPRPDVPRRRRRGDRRHLAVRRRRLA